MSTGDSRRFGELEDEIHGEVLREIEAQAADLDDAALLPELDPVARRGDGPSYSSYIEATFRRRDGEPHDVLFFYVVRDGRQVVQRGEARRWISATVKDIIESTAEEHC
jgi:hypothetical protein